MNKPIRRIAACAGLALAILPLTAATPAQAKDDSGKEPKPQPCALNQCVVSGIKLDNEMGGTYEFTYQGREIQLCCQHCLPKFEKHPARYLKKIDRAAEVNEATAQTAYPIPALDDRPGGLAWPGY